VLFAGHAGTPSALADEQPEVPYDRDHASDIAARWRLLCLFLMPDARWPLLQVRYPPNPEGL